MKAPSTAVPEWLKGSGMGAISLHAPVLESNACARAVVVMSSVWNPPKT